MPKLGINATADETNRLAVASPASLFSHVGNGHQIKVNKAAPADTASLLFPTAWSGRAEMGLAGNDDFAIKVSPDGSAWQTGLAISPQGVVTTPGRPLVRASAPSGTSSPANGSQTGFGDPGIVQGGFSLGDAVAGGVGHRLVVPASGIYLLLLANGSVTLAMVTSPALSGPGRQTAAGLAFLTAGDGLTLLYSGTAQVEFGNGKTEIVALLL
jgi:hypothetical protein